MRRTANQIEHIDNNRLPGLKLDADYKPFYGADLEKVKPWKEFNNQRPVENRKGKMRILRDFVRLLPL